MHSVAHPWDQACSILQALILPSGRPASLTRGSRNKVQATELVFKARSTSAARFTLPNKVLENLKINSNFVGRPKLLFIAAALNSPLGSVGVQQKSLLNQGKIQVPSLCLKLTPSVSSSSFQSQMMSTTWSWTLRPRWTAKRTPRSTCRDERRL